MIASSGLLETVPDGALIGGEYRVVRKLAEGGMGSVFVARQESTGNLRALKVIRGALMVGERGEEPELRERFDREAKLAARIKSDHVVQIIHAGTDAALRVEFLVMELLEGETLASRVARVGAVPPLEALIMVRQIAHGLSAAHAIGVIHRDLKPENVFLAEATRAGEPFVLKILDFGIAKVLADAKTASTKPLGTPAWLAPEQTDRKSRVGPETDIWAFGLIVFFVLTGRPYWLASNDDEAGLSALMREVLFDPLPPASARAAELQQLERRRALGALPAGFDAWFSRAVVRDPKARFPTVAHAVSALEGLLAPAGDSFGDRPTEFAASGATSIVDGTHAGSPGRSVDPAPGPSLGAAIARPTPIAAIGSSPSREGVPSRRSSPARVALPIAGLLLAGGGGFAAWWFTRDESPRTTASSAPSQASSAPSTTPPLPSAPRSARPRPDATNRWVRIPNRSVEMQAHEITQSEFGDPPSVQDRHPKLGVSWADAGAYCTSIGARLPDESEWRAASQQLEASPPSDEDVPSKKIGPVGTRPADQVGGFMDLWGNALEWTSTPFEEPGPSRWIVLGRSLARPEALGRYALGNSSDVQPQPLMVLARFEDFALELEEGQERALEACAEVPFDAKVTLRRGPSGKPNATKVELTPPRAPACAQVFEKYPWETMAPEDVTDVDITFRVTLQAPDVQLADVGFRCARDAKP